MNRNHLVSTIINWIFEQKTPLKQGFDQMIKQ